VAPIELTIPREREFGAVADLVLAGLASRADVTIETIDDLQLALISLLEQDEGEHELVVRLSVEGGGITATVGPFERDAIEPELEHDGGTEEIGLRRVLATTVDRVELTDLDGACWVELRKEVART
jgi:hypothetical protein